MTEAEWRAACDTIEPMLRHLRRRKRRAPSDRKCRLFACACFRRLPAVMEHDQSGWKVEVAERFADGQATREELREASTDYRGFNTFYAASEDIRTAIWSAASIAAFYAANIAERDALKADGPLVRRLTTEAEDRAQAALARCVFGNPFRPVALDRAWLTSDVLALAGGIYAERAFDRMPILADALQDAGCTNDDVLDHCRGAGAHVRGCWVVDQVLGKA